MDVRLRSGHVVNGWGRVGLNEDIDLDARLMIGGGALVVMVGREWRHLNG